MIKTNATFESQHRYTSQPRHARELEEMAHKGLSIPETVEVSFAVFMAMCQEANLQREPRPDPLIFGKSLPSPVLD